MDQNNNGLNEVKQPKDSEIFFRNQARIFYNFLYTQVATCSMAAAATSISQKNLTRFKRRFEKEGLLWVVRIGICRHTKHRAQYLTTNPAWATDTLTPKQKTDE